MDTLKAQLVDTVPCQPIVIPLTANGEPEFSYVLPRAKALFIKELQNVHSKTHVVLDKEIRAYYNDSGILITNSDYPLKIAQDQFLFTPLSYYFEFEGMDAGYLSHTYTFLISIPIIRTGRSVRKMGTINLVMSVEDKETINLQEDTLSRNSDYIKKWRFLKSYKRIITIKNIKGIHIPEAKIND